MEECAVKTQIPLCFYNRNNCLADNEFQVTNGTNGCWRGVE